jgi:hypothetical protein
MTKSCYAGKNNVAHQISGDHFQGNTLPPHHQPISQRNRNPLWQPGPVKNAGNV